MALGDRSPRGANRMLDVGLGCIGLAVAIPCIAVSALAMRILGDRGPVIYRAQRIGEGGRVITVYKIRTMRPASPGLAITSRDDDRITPLGRVLRRYKIDEMPQFLNVVRGEMSVVGPRPEDPIYADWSDPLHRFVFSARPGITGPTQLAFRDEELMLAVADPEAVYRTEILPRKLAIDAEYLERRTVRSDLGVVAATVGAMFRSD
jgi:lipopolysaccharide/colanic/teichoic acid biosynthesis glycosyltransferase